MSTIFIERIKLLPFISLLCYFMKSPLANTVLESGSANFFSQRFSIFVRLFIFLLVMSLVWASSVEATVYVDQNASGVNDGTSWENAYTELWQALPATGSDEIWVAAGTYKPTRPGGDIAATFTLKNGVAVYGGFAGTETARDQRDTVANPTILSGDLNGDDTYRYLNYHDGWWNMVDNSTHVVTASLTDASAILDGVEISHGAGWAPGGGGMYIEFGSPTVRNCRFYGNGSANGGAVYILNGSPTFTNCDFQSNFADIGSGGAIYVGGYTNPAGEVLVNNCRFFRNAAVGQGTNDGDGGAIYLYLYSTLTVVGSTFDSNLSGHRTYSGGEPSTGGAITSYGTLSISDSQFIKNRGHWGAALYTFSDTTVVNSIFTGNDAYPATTGFPLISGGYGGAMFINGVYTTNVTLSNLSISGNTAAENGAGLYLTAATGTSATNVALDNSIVWGNKVTKLVEPGDDPVPTVKQQIHTGNANLSIAYSDVQGLFETIPGEDPPDPAKFPGSLDVDPMFVDAVAHNLRLSQASPVIDAGDNGAIFAGVVTDLDANARRFDDPMTIDTGNGIAPIVDMGAYEFGSVPLPQDTDADGVADINDNCTLVPNPTQRDTDADGYGNFCDPDFDNDGLIGFVDQAMMKSRFFTADPDADLDGDGIVGFGDLVIMKALFFGLPGPSGLVL